MGVADIVCNPHLFLGMRLNLSSTNQPIYCTNQSILSRSKHHLGDVQDMQCLVDQEGTSWACDYYGTDIHVVLSIFMYKLFFSNFEFFEYYNRLHCKNVGQTIYPMLVQL